MLRTILLVLLAGCLASCKSTPSGPQRLLVLSMTPPELQPGQVVLVTARPEPAADLAWVSGTVKVMGFPDMAFTKDLRDGLWKIKTMIPIFASIPSGNYEAEAWGMTKDGQRYEGTLGVRVK